MALRPLPSDDPRAAGGAHRIPALACNRHPGCCHASGGGKPRAAVEAPGGRPGGVLGRWACSESGGGNRRAYARGRAGSAERSDAGIAWAPQPCPVQCIGGQAPSRGSLRSDCPGATPRHRAGLVTVRRGRVRSERVAHRKVAPGIRFGTARWRGVRHAAVVVGRGRCRSRRGGGLPGCGRCRSRRGGRPQDVADTGMGWAESRYGMGAPAGPHRGEAGMGWAGSRYEMGAPAGSHRGEAGTRWAPMPVCDGRPPYRRPGKETGWRDGMAWADAGR